MHVLADEAGPAVPPSDRTSTTGPAPGARHAPPCAPHRSRAPLHGARGLRAQPPLPPGAQVFKLQEGLQGAARGSRVPIVRHASCAMSSTFPLYDHLEPASIISF